MDNLKKVDHAALKTNQIIIVALNILAFILNIPWLVAGVTLFMLAGTLLGVTGFGFVYFKALKPLGWLKPDILLDHPEPHRFAQGFGGVVMLGGTLALFLGAPGLGWALVWLVAALAALNAFAGFCVGCFVYYWFNRIGVPGFREAPLPGIFPGMRPKDVLHDS